jgi:hypothetical protein
MVGSSIEPNMTQRAELSRLLKDYGVLKSNVKGGATLPLGSCQTSNRRSPTRLGSVTASAVKLSPFGFPHAVRVINVDRSSC